MYNYGVYGNHSPFTHILSAAELDALQPGELTTLIADLPTYNHKVLYYGPLNAASLIEVLEKSHGSSLPLKPVPAPVKFEQKEVSTPKVYIVDYDMKQAEILMLSRSDTYKPSVVPVVRLFNEYFGGSMNSIVFQEIRESKGLAYSAYAGYRQPQQPYQHFYLFSYIGTQNDKLPEAMKAMMALFNQTPESDLALGAAREAILNKIRTERITKSQVLFNYINAQKFGLTADIRKQVYEQIPSMTFSDLKQFEDRYIRDKKFNIMVLGKKNDLDIKTLSSYGQVHYLKLEDVFGF
jgi:predicted Zn-dependent peptidase